jgi:uncharacterized YceG family protein
LRADPAPREEEPFELDAWPTERHAAPGEPIDDRTREFSASEAADAAALDEQTRQFTAAEAAEAEDEEPAEPLDDRTRRFTVAEAAEAAEAEGAREPEPEATDAPARASGGGATEEFSAADTAEALGRTRRRLRPPAERDDELDVDWQDVGGAPRGVPRPDRPLRQIQPDPAPAPPAAAGSLPDAPPAPKPQRRHRRPRGRRRGGAVMTPPGDVPRGPRKRRSTPARIAAIVALLVVVAAVLWLVSTVFQPFKGDGTDSVTVVIPAGSSAGQIGDILAKKGVVDHGLVFSLRASLSGKRGDLRSGRHVLRRDMSYGAAIAALSAKPSDAAAGQVVKITIPEGRSRREIQPLVTRAGLHGSYVAATAKAPKGFSLRHYGAPSDGSLEGFLFPATYDIPAGASAGALVGRQLAAFKDNFAKVSLTKARRRNLDAYDVLIIASMIEREARLARERPLIASVIYNRLHEGLPLGIDATTRYATGNWSRPLTQSELTRDGPYNTRKHTGLPPTPIGNPGLASIRAAASPAKRDYLYYVVKPGTCGHAFSSTDAQFERDRARYEEARAKNGGRSPTKC